MLYQRGLLFLEFSLFLYIYTDTSAVNNVSVVGNGVAHERTGKVSC